MFEKYTVEFKSDKDKSNLPGAYEVRKGTIITEDDLPVLTDDEWEIEKWHVNYVVNNVRKSEDFKGSLEVNSNVIFTAVWKEIVLPEEQKKVKENIRIDDFGFKYSPHFSTEFYEGKDENIFLSCHYTFFNVKEDSQFCIEYLGHLNENVYKLPDISIKVFLSEWEYDFEKEEWKNNEEDDIFLEEIKLDEKFDSLCKEEYFSKFRKPDSVTVFNTFSFEITIKEDEVIKKTMKLKGPYRFIYADNGNRKGACTEELENIFNNCEMKQKDVYELGKIYLIYDYYWEYEDHCIGFYQQVKNFD